MLDQLRQQALSATDPLNIWKGLRAIHLDGVVLGLGGVLWVTRALTSQLYGVSSTDPTVFAAVARVLIAVAATATLIPAHRATGVNPVTMLRDE